MKDQHYHHMFVVLARLHRVAEVFQDGEWHTAASISESEELSTKSVYRLLDFLRDNLRWEFESGSHGFRLLKTNQQLISQP